MDKPPCDLGYTNRFSRPTYARPWERVEANMSWLGEPITLQEYERKVLLAAVFNEPERS